MIKKVMKKNMQKNLEEEIFIVRRIKDFIGYHILAEFSELENVELIKYKKDLEKIIEKVIKESSLKLVESGNNPNFYQFKPYGVTGIALLQESHLSFHSWPEKNYIAIDIFSCSGKEQAEKAYKLCKKLLRPNKIKKIIVYRNP